MKKIVITFFLTLMISNLFAGEKDNLRHKVLQVNYRIDMPVTNVTIATTFWGLAVVDKKPLLDSITITGLGANDINRDDRSAIWQHADFAPNAGFFTAKVLKHFPGDVINGLDLSYNL